MPRRFSTDIELIGFSLLHAMLNPVSSDPSLSSGDAGRVWFRTDTTPPTLKFWTGTTAIDVKDLATGTGTLLSSKVSDLAATVQAYRLDQFAAPTAAISLASHKLTNVTDGTSAQDAATKGQLDAALAALTSGQVIKGAVRCAATTNISLTSPGATIDTVSMALNDVVLLTAQTTGSQNGPYVWTASGATMARATNWDTSGEAVLGSYWVVQQGSHADQYALMTNDAAITLGTDTPLFTFIGGITITGSSSIQVSSGVVSAILAANSGLLSASGLAIDSSKVTQKVGGTVPSATSAPFTVSGAVVTVNHALANYAPIVIVRAYTTPASGYTQGQLVEMDNVATDANNVQITFPGASITANNWIVEIYG